MTRGLVEESGMFRSRPVGVVDQEGHVLHIGTLPNYVPDAKGRMLMFLRTKQAGISSIHTYSLVILFRYMMLMSL